jgi:hypothetical protein
MEISSLHCGFSPDKTAVHLEDSVSMNATAVDDT